MIYTFEAQYTIFNQYGSCGEPFTREITIDTTPVMGTDEASEYNIYLLAMTRALDMKQANEMLNSVSCLSY